MKNLALLILLGAIGTGINMIHWIPSKILEITLILILLLIIFAMGYLIYKITIDIYVNSQRKSKLFLGLVSFLLTAFFLGTIFSNFFYFAFSGIYNKEYTFEGKTFYIYEVGFVDSIKEVSIKIDYLPVRTIFISFINFNGESKLIKRGKYLYYYDGKDEIKLYDLETFTDAYEGA